MPTIGNTLANKVVALLSAPPGISNLVANLAHADGVSPLPTVGTITTSYAPIEFLEKSLNVSYPAVYVHCGKLSNQLKEKFRSFSGKAQVSVDVRHAQDRLDGLEMALQAYAEAVCQTLDQNRGDWGNGAYYGGGYEATFYPVRHGGRNFLQSAAITFDVDVSI